MLFALALPFESIDVIPRPQIVEMQPGRVQLADGWSIAGPAEAKEAISQLKKYLLPTGTRLRSGSTKSDAIVFVKKADTELGEEGYQLDASGTTITITANSGAGFFYGVQTLEQLLPPNAHTPQDLSLPAVSIRDWPRFPWRGMHLDVSRHFFPKKEIERYLDFIAMNKMNVFHWHLVDDGGWRMEVKKYPKLTQIGAFRDGVRNGWLQSNLKFDSDPGTKYGGFYSQKEIREIVEYAAKRNITVVPEIEMPGHSMPGLAAYPDLACKGVAGLWKQATGMNHPNVYCAGKEETYKFLQDVLDETMAMFPSKYIHVGGDEVDKFLWNHCDDCKAKMKAEGLRDENELQSYFMKRIDAYLTSKGRHLMGWDEILEGGLAQGAAVMSWRGIDGGIAAAKSGHDVVMSPTSHCYFDYPYTSISTKMAYGYEPVPAELNAEEAKLVLGAQGNVWTEWMNDFDRVMVMAMPRMQAMAEATWTNPDRKSWPDFSRRLGACYQRLDAMSAGYYTPAPVATFDALIFDDKATVGFEKAALQGTTLRYTTDGTEPNSASREYTGPFEIDHSATIRAATFTRKGHSDVVTIGAVKFSASAPQNLQPGLDVRIKEGQFSKVPDFDRSQSTKQMFTSAFDLSMFGMAENYALDYAGYLKVPTDGTYTFYLTSDDGSVLKIAGATVIDHDGLHAPSEKSGRVMLKAGLYPFELRFFQSGGAQALKLEVEGSGLSRQAIPADWLSH